MKRSAFLLDLSREHHGALSLARRIATAADEAALDGLIGVAADAFGRDIEPHFRVEEEGLLVQLAARGEDGLVRRTLDDHARLRELASRLAGGDRSALQAFGAALRDHVRFEERELFVRAEAILPAAAHSRVA